MNSTVMVTPDVAKPVVVPLFHTNGTGQGPVLESIEKEDIKGAITHKAIKKLSCSRVLNTVGTHPYDQVKWIKRDVRITDFQTGKVIFAQDQVETPENWSDQAVKIVVNKYFYGSLKPKEREHPEERETSIKQLINRIVKTYTMWAKELELYASEEEYQIFEEELTYIILFQYGSFNSPVWFNLGHYEQHRWGRPQVKGKKTKGITSAYRYNLAKGVFEASKHGFEYCQTGACFILDVQDDMGAILNHYVEEGKIFYGGSGAGTNVSSLRSSFEPVSGGGKASGPISFDRGWDKSAGGIKSGGKNRRAARMIELNVHHPDIFQFIKVKAKQEKIAKILIEQHGYPAGMDDLILGETVNHQNANHSVSVDEPFIRAVKEDGDYSTRWVTDPTHIEHTVKARDLYREIMESIWANGEPGFQFNHTMNKWNPVINSGLITGTNPCGEFVFLPNNACNLMSLNLLKFWCPENRTFDYFGFKQAVFIMIVCGELNNCFSGFPTEKIAKGSAQFRTIGLGYGNLAALLKCIGIPYDDARARTICGLITSVMTAEAYMTSSQLARSLDPFSEFEKNREPFLKVMNMHLEKAEELEQETIAVFPQTDPYHNVMKNLNGRSMSRWLQVCSDVEKYGVRNAQVSLIAPTGTIGFMMDYDSFGIEPEFAIVTYKTLSGGGSLKMPSKTTVQALQSLGYNTEQVNRISKYVEQNDMIEGCVDLKEEHLPVFDCAVKAAGGKGHRFIKPEAHIRMMASAQRFLSGGISKTNNVPEDTTIDQLWDLFLLAEELGVKAFTIYRDGSRGMAPLSTSAGKSKEEKTQEEPTEVPTRLAMPDEALAFRRKFKIGDHSGYIHVGLYKTGRIGEVFLTINKEGDTVSGFAGVFAKMLSTMLQSGHRLQEIVNTLGYTKFEPSGYTTVREVSFAHSIVDFVVRYLGAVEKEIKELGVEKFLFRNLTILPVVLDDSKENRDALGITQKGYRKYKSCPSCQNPNVKDPDGCPSCPQCGWSGGCSGG